MRRLLADIKKEEPVRITCRLDFEPGEAAQVDFGAVPMVMHPDSPRLTGIPAYLATSSQRCASNHAMHPCIALHAICLDC